MSPIRFSLAYYWFTKNEMGWERTSKATVIKEIGGPNPPNQRWTNYVFYFFI